MQLSHPNRQIAKEKGEKQYFTAEPCNRGHLANRFVSGGNCIECLKITKKNFRNTEHGRASDKEYVKRYKATVIKQTYGITIEERNDILWNQGYCCAICSEKLDMNKRTHIDHCHETKRVRGILCQFCNIGIGFFKHNPSLLRKAALYCEKE